MLLERDKICFLSLVAAVMMTCLTGQTALAQKSVKIFVVKSNNISSYNKAYEGFKKSSSPAWTIAEYDLAGTFQNNDKMVSAISEAKPDLVLAIGAKALTAVTQSKITLPVVFCAAINIAKDDLANSNITGISLTVSPQEQLQILSSLSPKIRTIGIMLREKNASHLLKTVVNSADGKKINIVPVPLGSEKEIPVQLRSVIDKIDALWMLDDAYIHSKETLEFVVGSTIENNIPFMATSEVFVEVGATIALSPSFFDNGRQAANMVQRILDQNLQPRDVPISYHENPDLVLNLKIADKIGLEVPPELTNSAKIVYK